ncbi:MAG: hypothetical protein ACPGYP_01220 [Solirubrobacterales bacterium]
MNAQLAVDTLKLLNRLAVDQGITLSINYSDQAPVETAWHVSTSTGEGALGADLLEALQEVQQRIVRSHEIPA